MDLLQGTLDVLVLRALSFGPLHGYAVARFIGESSDGAFRILDGALYTSLHRMEERGWIVGHWQQKSGERRRRFYRITAGGRRTLAGEGAEPVRVHGAPRPRYRALDAWPRALPGAHGGVGGG